MAAFIPKKTDYDISPYTGLTRESWIEAGEYLLTGIFNNIRDIDMPIVMPRAETEVTYPHLNAPENIQAAERKAEIFEGLTRSFFIASVLVADDPGLNINGISIRDYYRLHILRSCTDRASDEYVGSYEQMQEITESEDPFRPYQQTVETCALVIGLYMCRDVIWDSYSDEEKDMIASFISGFAHANTVPQNWRLFNMLDMAFLHMNGYDIDEDIMAEHALAIRNYYVGNGWYRDGHSFDYYSVWAFNMYAPLWNMWYGYDNMPEIARDYEDASNELIKSFADMFDEDGHVNMWGRSCIYRNAVTSAFDGNMFLRSSSVDPGLARRISSGCLLQFITREDLLENGIPSLGFYGQFTPLIQPYSCAESPFWLGKAFLCLHLPPSHPFWTDTENNGTWDKLKAGEVKETVLDGPALVFTNHKATGETVLRTAKVLKKRGDRHGMWNYSKLCYNTKYPWESTPVKVSDTGDCADTDNIESQQYVLKSGFDGHTERGNVTFYAGSSKGVLYRRQFFEYDMQEECHWMQAVDLADYPVANGIMRVDRFRICKRPMEITLGSYGMPDTGDITVNRHTGKAIEIMGAEETAGAFCVIPEAMVIRTTDAAGRVRQMAMTIYTGFKELEVIKSRGTNPVSEFSYIICAGGGLYRQYDASEEVIYISQVITATDDDISEAMLFPIEKIVLHGASKDKRDNYITGSAGSIDICHRSGTCMSIDYSHIEGNMSM